MQYRHLQCTSDHHEVSVPKWPSTRSAVHIPLIIGVGRFRILGWGWGQGLEYLGGGERGPNSKQAHDVVLTSMRRNDVASTSF